MLEEPLSANEIYQLLPVGFANEQTQSHFDQVVNFSRLIACYGNDRLKYNLNIEKMML